MHDNGGTPCIEKISIISIMILDVARRADSRSKVAISRLVSKSKTRQIGIQMAYPLSIPEECLSKTYLKGGIRQEPPDLLLFAKP